MTIERNQFNQAWLEAGRKAGFTDAQLQFLEEWYKRRSVD
jgi:hypothetical protein